MPYWQLFFHMVWSTKNREPLLEANVEAVIYDFLLGKAIGLGATVFALNGIKDHVHMVAAVPPKIALATFIDQIKAVASTKFNKSGLSKEPIFWQEEYGVFSFDGKRLPNYIGYVECQKEHHAQNTTISVLERTGDTAGRLIREMATDFSLEELEWRRDLEKLI